MEGTLGILIDDTNKVLCVKTDFDNNGYGGLTLTESQKVRIKQDISHAFSYEWLPVFLHDVLSADTKNRILKDLIQSNKAKLIFKNMDLKEQTPDE